MKLKYSFLILGFVCFCGLNAQKLGNHFQYATFEKYIYTGSRVQPVNENQYFWILDDNAISSSKSMNLDSLVLVNVPQNYRKKLSYKTLNTQDVAVAFMNAKTPNWLVNLTATSLNSTVGNINVVNALISGNDLLLYCKVTGDSILCFSEFQKTSAFNIPDTSGYAVIKISQSAAVSLQNYFVTGNIQNQTKLIWANDKKYCLYFQTPPPPRAATPFHKTIPKQLLLPDSQSTAILLQYEFGQTNIVNSMVGTFPVSFNTTTSNLCFRNDGALIAGNYAPTMASNFPYFPVYKINNSSPVSIKRPVNFSRKKNYLYWINVNMDSWSIDEIEFVNSSDTLFPFIYDCGQLADGYWFQCSKMDSIALDQTVLKWQKINNYNKSLFTYNPKTKKIHSLGFPNGIIHTFSDGDSLIFLTGDNNGAYNTPTVDMDESPYFKYPLAKGKYSAEYRMDGSLVWARNEDISTNHPYSTQFVSHHSARYLSLFNDLRPDLDYGFKKTAKQPLNSVNGTVTQLSKAPICDFDIEKITYNHVTINYKGALNANFYFKYGDGSVDSNFNQRTFIHSYKKTGIFLLYCVAKNDFGSDTAFYEININDIVSTKKLDKNKTLNFFPNPTENTLNWEAESTSHVDIFNVNSQFIERIQTSQNSINMAHLPAGIYFVTVHTHNGSFINKVVKY